MHLWRLMEMKNKFLITIIFFLGISSISYAQDRPRVVFPGETFSVNSKTDTLWIINNTQFKRTIIDHKQLKIANSQIEEQTKIIDKLKEINSTSKDLVDTLKSDRNFYKTNWLKAEDDVKTLADMNNKSAMYLRIAIITGGVTTVVAFLAGVFLIH